MADKPGFTSADERRVLFSTLLLILSAIVLTMIVPGVVAGLRGVYYQKDIEQVIRTRLPATGKQLTDFNTGKEARKKRLEDVDRALDEAVSTQNSAAVQSLLLLRQHLEKQQASATPPVSAIPFHLNPQLLMWPAIYACLGWLVFVFPPTVGTGPRKRYIRPTIRVALQALALLIYAAYEWPTWMRNFILWNDGRRPASSSSRTSSGRSWPGITTSGTSSPRSPCTYSGASRGR